MATLIVAYFFEVLLVLVIRLFIRMFEPLK